MKHKRLILKIMAAVFIILLQMNAYSYINFNGAGNGYENPFKSAISTSNTLEYYIVESAGYYLAAGSHIQTLLYMVELQDVRGLDFTAVNKSVDAATAYMNKALGSFEKLISQAETMPYNEAVQARLNTFDYDAFADANGLNTGIFAAVKEFLKRGDITGTFKRAHSEFARILKLLQTIKAETSIGNLPGVDIFWELNERFSTASLFGSYEARIFAAVK